jgi:hypothetical protein
MTALRIAGLATLVAFASATTVLGQNLNVTITADSGGMTNMIMPGTPTGSPGEYEYIGGDVTGKWDCQWDVTTSDFPFVSASVTLENTSTVSQIYTVTLSEANAPILPSTLIGGSFGGSMTDANNNGTGGVSTATGDPLYYGLIDGTGVLPIYSDPTSFTFDFMGQTKNIPALNPGLPGPTIPGPGMSSSLGIEMRFELSPEDRVAMTAFFDVEVPEPSSLLLLGFGALFLRRRRLA